MGKYQNAVKDFVSSNKNLTYPQIVAFLLSLGSRQAYAAAKKEFARLDINVDAMKFAHKNKKEEERKDRIAKQDHIVMYTDAAFSHQRFCVYSSKISEPLWHGVFFDGVCNQAEAELEAAKKAVWLAGKVAEKLNKRLTLLLYTDAQWLTCQTFNSKARVLSDLAYRYKIDLVIEHIPGKENPADEYTRSRGFKKYDLDEVVGLVENSPLNLE